MLTAGSRRCSRSAGAGPGRSTRPCGRSSPSTSRDRVRVATPPGPRPGRTWRTSWPRSPQRLGGSSVLETPHGAGLCTPRGGAPARLIDAELGRSSRPCTRPPRTAGRRRAAQRSGDVPAVKVGRAFLVPMTTAASCSAGGGSSVHHEPTATRGSPGTRPRSSRPSPPSSQTENARRPRPSAGSVRCPRRWTATTSTCATSARLDPGSVRRCGARSRPARGARVAVAVRDPFTVQVLGLRSRGGGC